MSGKSKPPTLAERLNSTGNKLAELSKKVSESTKSAVGNANESIKNAIAENKQKRDAKKQQKLEFYESGRTHHFHFELQTKF